MSFVRQSSSIRDPSGFIFTRDSVIFRQVNSVYKENYDHLLNSGLYKALVDAGLLIPHIEMDIKYKVTDNAYVVIKPETIPFISYPYEWCFSQLKAAALITLCVQKKALEYDMSLKDCSAYNIQFNKGRPILIDSLSFEKYNEGQPWIAYKQFCQHFLAPLALMSYKDIRLNQLFKFFLDGIPLDFASSFLPLSALLNFNLLLHIHLHAKTQKHFSRKNIKARKAKIGLQFFLGLIDTLESAIKKLKWQKSKSEWIDYYYDSNYSREAFMYKKKLVNEFLDISKPRTIWDIGANIGVFSRIAAAKGIQTISMDNDPACVEGNYLECIKNNETNILPILLDIANPSPNIGWQNQERMSIFERGPADAVLALALVHHLAISNNIPFDMLSSFFNKIGNWLIIEFVPKHDSQIQRLLRTREDIFTDYNQSNFDVAFLKYFQIQKSEKIKHSERTLYLMKRK